MATISCLGSSLFVKTDTSPDSFVIVNRALSDASPISTRVRPINRCLLVLRRIKLLSRKMLQVALTSSLRGC